MNMLALIQELRLAGVKEPEIISRLMPLANQVFPPETLERILASDEHLTIYAP